MLFKFTKAQEDEVKSLVKKADEAELDFNEAEDDYEKQQLIITQPLEKALTTWLKAASAVRKFVTKVKAEQPPVLATDPLEPDKEDLELYAKYILPSERENTREIRTISGVIELRPWRDGVWMVLENNQDVASIGLKDKEVDQLIGLLNEYKMKKIGY